jgi:hypothetical protein
MARITTADLQIVPLRVTSPVMLLAFPSINDLPAQERLLLMEGLVESAMAENAVITQLHTECLTALRTVRREVWRFGGWWGKMTYRV